MYEKTKKLVSHLFFPDLITAAVTGSILLMDRGVSAEVVTASVIFASYFYLALLEQLFPLHREWLGSHGDVGTDAALGATNAVINFGFQPLILAGAAGVAAWLSAWIGIGLWPDGWPLIVQLVPALLLGELVEYSVHRSMHEVPWLWRFHAPHHSSTRLYWLNAVRFHPVDVLLIGPSKLIPLVLLGAGGDVMALVLIFAAVHGSCQHANIPCRIGPLNWIFSMAELHRWHHSPVLAEANHNYGGNLIFWDIVFGTRWMPKDREPPVGIGIESLPDFPKRYSELMLAPFRWKRVLAEASPSPSPSLED